MSRVRVNGIDLHVQRLGGPQPSPGPVVFLHGLVMDNLSSWYFTVANKVAVHREVVLYDLRGHGKSQRPERGYHIEDLMADLAALLDALDIKTPVGLVGNSFGGLLALAFAAAQPTRVERIALVDAHIGARGWGQAMAATLSLDGQERDRKIAESFKSWLGRHSARKTTRLAQAAHALVYRTSLVQDLRASPGLSRENLAAIECPVLAIYGEHSDIRQDADRLASMLPRCRVTVLPGCSHSVLWEATAEVSRAIEEWFSPPPQMRLEPSRSGQNFTTNSSLFRR